MSGPERIWAFDHQHIGAITHGEWADCIRHGGGDEYIRADLHAAAIARAERAEAELAEARAEMLKDQRRLCAADWRRKWWHHRAERAEAALAVAEEALRMIANPELSFLYESREISDEAIAQIAALKGGAQ